MSSDWLHRIRSLDSRRRGADQGGFALIAVLAIIGLFSLLIVAVLSQTTVATNITATQRVYVGTNRSAEGAIEMAINELVRQDVDDLEDQGHPCDPLRPGGAPFEAEVDGRSVQVHCEVPPPSEGGEFETLIPAESGEIGRTVLLGSAADSRQLPSDGLARWNTTCGTSPAQTFYAGCFPWAESLHALWAPTGYNAPWMQSDVINPLNPTLAHSAPETLVFGGDVDVRGTVAASLNPAAGSGPAVNVAGEYRQGRTVAPNIAYGDVGECRYISPRWGTRPLASVWVQLQPDVAVHDVSGDPVCGDAVAAAMRDVPGTDVTDESRPSPAPWSIASVQTNRVTVPSCSQPTTALLPGAYTPAQIAAINTLIENCSATIWFRPGDYWLAGDLVIDNPNAKVVFGERGGPDGNTWQFQTGADASHFPDACAPDADGVSIALRENARILHHAGRVAICNRNNGIETALHQNPTVPSEWMPGLATAENISTDKNHTDWNGVGGEGGSWSAPPTTERLGAGGAVASWSRPCSTSWLIIVNCNAKAGVRVTLPASAPSPSAPLESFNVRMVADTSDLLTGWDFLGSAHVNLRNEVAGGDIALVRISARKGSGTPCYRHFQGLPNWGNAADVPLAYDLLAPSEIIAEQAEVDGCWKTTFATQADLQGAEVRVDFLFRARYVDLNPFNALTRRDVSLDIDELSVQAGWPVNPIEVTPGASGVLTRDGGSVSTTVRCRTTSCPSETPIAFTVNNFSGSDLGHVPSAGRPDRVVLEVTGRNRQASEPGLARTTAVISVPGRSGSCTVQVPHIPSFGQTFQIELVAGTSGPCASIIQDPLDVMNAVAAVTVKLDCYNPAFTRGCFRFLGLGVGSISANVDHVRIVGFTTADSTRRSPMRVTSNATSAPAGSSFYVDGDVSVTRRDLEVDWAGPAQSTPLFNGDLVLNGLSSVASTEGAEVGTVCCVLTRSTARQVVLTAVVGAIDPTVVARSHVKLTDVDGSGELTPGRDVTVREFNVCRSEPAGLTPAEVLATECRTNVRSVPATP